MDGRPPDRGNNSSLVDRFLGKRAYRPMVLTIAGAMVVLFGSMYMGMRELGGHSDIFLNNVYAWCSVLSLWTMVGATLWALVTWIGRWRGGKKD
jgi:hypothetical protein